MVEVMANKIMHELMVEEDFLMPIFGRNLMTPSPRPRFDSSPNKLTNEIMADAMPISASEINLVAKNQKRKPSPMVPILLAKRKDAFMINGPLMYEVF